MQQAQRFRRPLWSRHVVSYWENREEGSEEKRDGTRRHKPLPFNRPNKVSRIISPAAPFLVSPSATIKYTSKEVELGVGATVNDSSNRTSHTRLWSRRKLNSNHLCSVSKSSKGPNSVNMFSTIVLGTILTQISERFLIRFWEVSEQFLASFRVITIIAIKCNIALVWWVSVELRAIHLRFAGGPQCSYVIWSRKN